VDDALILGLQRGQPALFLNTDDAAARNIADGDMVEAFNDVASFRARSIVSPAVRPGQAVIYHAWENYQFESWGHFKSVMATPLNPIELVGDYGHIRPDALICMPGQSDRDTRVEVRKVESHA
jgi:nitrate reductase alpha subunit